VCQGDVPPAFNPESSPEPDAVKGVRPLRGLYRQGCGIVLEHGVIRVEAGLAGYRLAKLSPGSVNSNVCL
jgi:hypothetical protein